MRFPLFGQLQAYLWLFVAVDLLFCGRGSSLQERQERRGAMTGSTHLKGEKKNAKN
jgi:hypothetical protein